MDAPILFYDVGQRIDDAGTLLGDSSFFAARTRVDACRRLRLDQREQLIEPDLQILDVICPQCGVAELAAGAPLLAVGVPTGTPTASAPWERGWSRDR